MALLAALITVQSCTQTEKKGEPITAKDVTITKENAYNTFFIDSTVFNSYLLDKKISDSMSNRLRSFYNSRNFQYAWFAPEGATEQAYSFWDQLADYISYSGDSSLLNKELRSQMEQLLADSAGLANTQSLQQTEIDLTATFFRYARRAYQGRSRFNLKELEWFIPRKKIDAIALLDSLVTNKGKNLERYEPVYPQYNLLKGRLEKYRTIENSGGWPTITTSQKSLKKGDKAPEISILKKRLYAEGDLMTVDTSDLFDDTLDAAVKRAQGRYGFATNGIVTTAMIAALNKSVELRIRQMLINMERIRWVPAEPTTDFLLVNIPEYKMHVFEQGRYQWSMDVVTGTPAHNTVIFSGALKYIVFSPYWNVPPGILKNEVLPGIKRNKNYLANHHMEWNGNSVRQKPGPWNSLGRVKFLFPNSYNIYLHDTPSKSLFGESKRAFSHGCIRLAEPKKLAEYLLRDNSKWDSDKIDKAMYSGKEQFVTVTEKVMVFIVYFTTWVDRNGLLNFRDDIYGRDGRLGKKMFE
jgi:murein L,D-transpeptidase YcbB/YkuD